MKKRLLPLAIVLIGLYLQSCKEVGVTIDGDNNSTGEIDTAYTTSKEVQTAKKLLVEEFTGVSCPPCAKGHELLAALKKELNDNMVTIGYYVFNYPLANPVEKNGKQLTKDDFRTEDATEVGQEIFTSVFALPLAAFDRVESGGELLFNKTDWSGNAKTNAANRTSPVNISITPSFNPDDRTAKVIVRLSYTEDVALKHNINIALLENNIIDAQKTTDAVGIIEDYTHDHVLRDVVTPVHGIAIPEKVFPITAGRVYERSFTFTVNEKWNADECSVVAYLNYNDPTDRSILQAEEVTLIK